MGDLDRTFSAEIRRLRHELHRHPELSLRERGTKERLIRFLRERTGLEIHEYEQWFYAVYRTSVTPRDGGRPRRLVFRADIDALPIDESLPLPHASTVPGVSHKCGHDGHAAALAGLALQVWREGAPNDVYFLFQAAEETGAGAALALPEILREAPDEIFAWHNMSGQKKGTVRLIEGTAQFASHGQILRYKGAKAHASEPEAARNPLYAMGEFLAAIPAAAAADRYTGPVFSTPVHVRAGEPAFGISPENAAVYLTNRAERNEDLEALKTDFENLWRKLAERDGLTYSFSYTDEFRATRNHPESVRKVRGLCDQLGIEHIDDTEPYRGSEDFGLYLEHIPGCMFYLGNGETYPPLHTDAYDFNDALLETAVPLLFALARS